jgi:hypothetical protein
MKSKQLSFTILLLLTIILGACGPSAEQIATMTASAWTPTPKPTSTPPPTPTATPVPYDLTVKVTDADGNPIAGASVIFPESGNGEPVAADDAGQVAWSNLDGPNGSLTVTAQGYFKAEQAVTLERGPNEVTVALQRDPFGMLPADACIAGEEQLYVEDFQDGRAQGWDEIDLRTPGWDVAPSDQDTGNVIVSARHTEMAQVLGSNLMNGSSFDDAVWRLRFMVSPKFSTEGNWFSFNWKFALQPFDLNGQEVFDSRYQIPLGRNALSLRRVQQPVTNIGIGVVTAPKFDEWHLIEISTYQVTTQVWLDGTRLMSYDDPQPIPAGTIGLEFWLQGSSTIVYLDNFAVCGLSAPFASAFVAP